MPKFIITLTMGWGCIADPTNPRQTSDSSWGIRINGLRPKQRDIFRENIVCQSMVEIDKGGVIDLVITKRQQPAFGSHKGACSTRPQFEYATEYLNALGAVGYEVSSHAVYKTGVGNNSISVWTLQMDR